MCEASAYLTGKEGERLLLQGLARMEVDAEEVTLTDVLGRTVTIRARIKELRLVDHRVVLEPL